MRRMVRKQIYIEQRQEVMLKRLARELDVPEAEIVRQGIDQVARVIQPLPPDVQAWDEEQEFIDQRRHLRVPQTGRTWTREQLYDDRLGRVSS